jgi:hypothetical protein
MKHVYAVLLGLLMVVLSSSVMARNLNVQESASSIERLAAKSIPHLMAISRPATADVPNSETLLAQNPSASPQNLIVPTPAGDCRIKLVPHARGNLAHCPTTNVTFGGPLIDCEHLSPAEQTAACVAAKQTMPNRATQRQFRAPLTPPPASKSK